MNKLKKKIQDFIIYYSYKSRKKRSYEKFENEINELKKLSDLSLEAEYINTKTEYEFKKMKLSLFGVTIAIGIITNVLAKLYYFFEKIIPLIYTDKNNGDVGVILLYIFIIFTALIILIIYLFLTSYIKNLQFLYKHLMMIENIKKQK